MLCFNYPVAVPYFVERFDSGIYFWAYEDDVAVEVVHPNFEIVVCVGDISSADESDAVVDDDHFCVKSGVDSVKICESCAKSFCYAGGSHVCGGVVDSEFEIRVNDCDGGCAFCCGPCSPLVGDDLYFYVSLFCSANYFPEQEAAYFVIFPDVGCDFD